MKILYFAWIREAVGTDCETVSPPSSVETVGALADWLIEKGDGYDRALKDRTRFKAAVNQSFVGWNHPIRAGDEIAFFPPVTGG